MISLTQKLNNMTTTEVVIYQVKKDKLATFSEISKLSQGFLKTKEGFISRTVKQNHKDETLFLDVIEWQTLDNALNAAKKFEKEPSLIPFFEACEKVIIFNYFQSLKS
jgi:hypothetical protein